jgi:protein O-GlcNAc transferase
MDDVSPFIDMALNHQRAGRLDEAEAIYAKILDIRPDHADALHLAGMVAKARGDLETAASRIAKAILLSPETPDFHANIAAIHLAQGHPGPARAHCERALAADPDCTAAHYNLGNALFAQGDAEGAVRHLARARDLDPTNIRFQSNYLFALNFIAGADCRRVFAENRAWGAALEARVSPFEDFPNAPDPSRKLRLGYVLPEPSEHVTLRFLEPVLARHDPDRFDVFVYADISAGTPPPRRIVEGGGAWCDVSGHSAEQIAGAIHGDGIDILAHPCTFKARYRDVLAYRPAPVQIACINQVSTTGLARVDYLITDGRLDPPGETEDFYTERLIRLTNFNCYRPPADGRTVAPSPAAANGYVTFGSLNNPAKMTPGVIAVWAEIVGGVGGSKLLLKHRAFDDADARDAMTARFADHGLDAERLIFRGFTADRNAYLAAYEEIDIALDPFPFGGGTTSYEAIWMGVPVVTLRGETMMGRLSASLMEQVGGAAFVAASREDYAAAARAAAGDPASLATFRAGLRETARRTIFDAETHVRELEAAYRQAWDDYCRRAVSH